MVAGNKTGEIVGAAIRDGIQGLLDRFVESWNGADIRGLATCFSDSGDLVNTSGRMAHGREAIALLLDEEWTTKFGGTRALVRIESIRELAQAQALVDADMRIAGGGLSAALRMHVVFLVAAPNASRWRFEAARPYVLQAADTRADRTCDKLFNARPASADAPDGAHPAR